MKYIALLGFHNNILTSITLPKILEEVKVPIAHTVDLDSEEVEIKFVNLVFQFDTILREAFGKQYLLYRFLGWEE